MFDTRAYLRLTGRGGDRSTSREVRKRLPLNNDKATSQEILPQATVEEYPKSNGIATIVFRRGSALDEIPDLPFREGDVSQS